MLKKIIESTEYIHENAKAKAKTLFATHYQELNEMTSSFPRIKNYNVSVKEVGNKVIFLRKLSPGGSNHSFGIHVARMAGMPVKVVERAKDILQHLEKSHTREGLTSQSKADVAKAARETVASQLSFFQLDDPSLAQIREEILNLDLNMITPIEALMKLNEIRKIVGG